MSAFFNALCSIRVMLHTIEDNRRWGATCWIEVSKLSNKIICGRSWAHYNRAASTLNSMSCFVPPEHWKFILTEVSRRIATDGWISIKCWSPGANFTEDCGAIDSWWVDDIDALSSTMIDRCISTASQHSLWTFVIVIALLEWLSIVK